MIDSRHPPPQAKEFGVPEVWMNERIMRIAPRSFAEFLYAFEEANGKQPDLLWLVWRYEGDYTLFDLLQVALGHTHKITFLLVLTTAAQHLGSAAGLNQVTQPVVRHDDMAGNTRVLQVLPGCSLPLYSLMPGAAKAGLAVQCGGGHERPQAAQQQPQPEAQAGDHPWHDTPDPGRPQGLPQHRCADRHCA
jgi:hypothetical protein